MRDIIETLKEILGFIPLEELDTEKEVIEERVQSEVILGIKENNLQEIKMAKYKEKFWDDYFLEKTGKIKR